MARSSSPIEFNSFSKGLVTDTSKLNTQPDTAIDINNFELERDGTVRRRLGFEKLDVKRLDGGNIEDDFKTISEISDPARVATTVWKGAGDRNNTDIIVVSAAGKFGFFKQSDEGLALIPYADTGDFLEVTEVVTRTLNNGFSQVGNKFVVADRSGTLSYYDYDYINQEVVKESEFRLKVRDTWGLESVITDKNKTGFDLLDPANFGYRPEFDPSAATGSEARSDVVDYNYVYNKRNQGWARAMAVKGLSADPMPSYDPLREFFIRAPSATDSLLWPSLSDNINDFIYPDTTDTTNPTIDRFNGGDMVATSPQKIKAPYGHYIIDAFSRASSRQQAVQDTYDQPVSEYWAAPSTPTDLKSDNSVDYETPTCITEYAGRAFYAGFLGQNQPEGFFSSWEGQPDFSNAVFFSQLIDSYSKLGYCYQENDPTNKDNPDLLATDGGIVKIDGAVNINKLQPFADSLVIFAENGVWALSGNDSSGFTATGYRVYKITDNGVLSHNSVVKTNSGLLYATNDGVYAISTSEFGELTSSKITENILDKYFQNLSPGKVRTMSGAWNSDLNKVSWVMYDNTSTEELLLDLNLGAFYVNKIEGNYTVDKPALAAVIPLKRGTLANITGNVVVNPDNVVVGGDNVTVGTIGLSESDFGFLYLIMKNDPTGSGTFRYKQFGLATKTDTSFNDWETFPEGLNTWWTTITPSEAEAYLVTGYLTGGDTQRYKQVPYLTMLFEKTEDGFIEDAEGNWNPTNESSCKVQAQWEWTNLASSNRWGREFEAYRHKRFYIPTSLSDGYDDGHSVVVSKTKLRGKGRALSLKMRTEPGKDCHILGWSMNMGANNAV